MGNWQLGRADQPRALTRDALRSLRHGQPAGLSRRTLLRRSIGGGVALWLTEVLGGPWASSGPTSPAASEPRSSWAP